MSASITLYIDHTLKVTGGRVYAGALNALSLIPGTGVTWPSGATLRLTVKPAYDYTPATTPWTAVADTLAESGSNRTCTLDLTATAVRTWFGSRSRLVRLEVHDDTNDVPLAAADLTLYVQATHEDDVASTAVPARSYTDAQIDTALAAATAVPADPKTTPVDADKLTLWDSVASWACKGLTWGNLKTALGTVFAALTHAARHKTGGDDALTAADIGALATGSALLLDQTEPQTVANGAPVFGAGLKTGYVYPSADAVAGVQIRRADGSTPVVTFDTTNQRVGIGTIAPDRALEINVGAATGGLRLTYNDPNGSATVYADVRVDSAGNAIVTPKTSAAFVLGPAPDGSATGGNARGAYAVDIQGARYNATAVASGARSFASGYNNVASGADSVCMGRESAATAQSASVLGGSGNNANGNYSAVVGGTTGWADLYGQVVLGAIGRHGTYMTHVQRSSFLLRAVTTATDAKNLALDGASALLTINLGRSWFCTVKISAHQLDGSCGYAERRVYFRCAGPNVNIIGAVQTIGTDYWDAALGTPTIAITASGLPARNMKITVTPANATSTNWCAVVDALEQGNINWGS